MKQKKMMQMILLCIFAAVILSTGISCASENRVSGSVQNGYRILDISSTAEIQQFTAYRGDYIKFRLPQDITFSTAAFSTLKESRPLTRDLETTAYFKMKKAGVYPFNIGFIKGQIKVIEYQQAKYNELSAREADEFIKTYQPIIVDVRTLGEYKNGHLENSILIPVQKLQRRIEELNHHKNDTILIYCATGNRSTVASKILIDAGFTDIYNLRRGIADWVKNRYPIVQ